VYLLVGLGNPGSRYQGTRHNIGFDVLDAFAARHNISVDRRRFSSLFGKGRVDGCDVLLAKPETYMNLSGEAIRRITDYYNMSAADLLVWHDEMDLETGRIKVSTDSGPGGHKGVASIIQRLGAKDFVRVRLGVGRPAPGREGAEYVLSRFRPEEKDLIEEAKVDAVEAGEEFIFNGAASAQSRFNRRDKQV
jgi:PTH1 family peptidyl-tRNA hydrolase